MVASAGTATAGAVITLAIVSDLYEGRAAATMLSRLFLVLGAAPVLAKLAERGDIGRDERVVAYITGDGLKTLDTVRGTFEVTEIAPSIDEFDAAFAPDGVAV